MNRTVSTLAYLDSDLKRLLKAVGSNALLPNRPSRLTLEVFLAALCEAHFERMKHHFRNPGRIENLIQRYKPYPVQHIPPDEVSSLIVQTAAAFGAELPSEGVGAAPAFSIQLDPNLVRIFHKAIQLAQEARVPSAGISQFVNALSSEQEFLTTLASETGLILRADD